MMSIGAQKAGEAGFEIGKHYSPWRRKANSFYPEAHGTSIES
jgi:hypothetical protein